MEKLFPLHVISVAFLQRGLQEVGSGRLTGEGHSAMGAERAGGAREKSFAEGCTRSPVQPLKVYLARTVRPLNAQQIGSREGGKLALVGAELAVE